MEPTAEVLDSLLCSTPTEYYFYLGQRKQERQTLMDSIPAHGQEAIQMGLKNLVEAVQGVFDGSKPPIFYMLTDEEHCGSTDMDYSECRFMSEDWQLDMYTDGRNYFYDFRGFPNDNEMGVGLFRAEGSAPVLIYTNKDQVLVSQKHKLYAVLVTHASRRVGMGPDV